MATTAELLGLIFASEPDYHEIKERHDALVALGAARTSAQTAEMTDYAAKLAHDVTRITGWVAQLPTIVRNNLNGATQRAVRLSVLNNIRDDCVAERDALIADIVALAAQRQAGSITEEWHAEAVAARTARQANRQARIDRLIAVATLGVNVWGIS